MTREKEFWDWFIQNKSGLENFVNSNSKDYSLYNILASKVKQYNQDLFAEITINLKNEFVLVITCDGIISGIPHVIRLCDSAPEISNCVIQRFRQPKVINRLSFNGLSFTQDDMKIKAFANSGKFDTIIFIKGYSANDNRYGSLAFLYLDHFLGEYNVMTKIGAIEFKKLGLFTNKEGLISLADLNKQIASTFN